MKPKIYIKTATSCTHFIASI